MSYRITMSVTCEGDGLYEVTVGPRTFRTGDGGDSWRYADGSLAPDAMAGCLR